MYRRFRTSLTRLLVATYMQWVKENDDLHIIHVVVDTRLTDDPSNLADVSSPETGMVTLNISAEAVMNFAFLPDGLRFECRFKGVSREVYLPYQSLMYIYSIDSQGEPTGTLGLEHSGLHDLEKIMDVPTAKPAKAPILRLVK